MGKDTHCYTYNYIYNNSIKEKKEISEKEILFLLASLAEYILYRRKIQTLPLKEINKKTSMLYFSYLFSLVSYVVTLKLKYSDTKSYMIASILFVLEFIGIDS